eukprot:8772930-Prorocentrum_lima.AAC.1
MDVESRGLGDVYKRQGEEIPGNNKEHKIREKGENTTKKKRDTTTQQQTCLLYTSDAADDM